MFGNPLFSVKWAYTSLCSLFTHYYYEVEQLSTTYAFFYLKRKKEFFSLKHFNKRLMNEKNISS